MHETLHFPTAPARGLFARPSAFYVKRLASSAFVVPSHQHSDATNPLFRSGLPFADAMAEGYAKLAALLLYLVTALPSGNPPKIPDFISYEANFQFPLRLLRLRNSSPSRG